MDGKYYTFDGYEVVSLPNKMTKGGNAAPKRMMNVSKARSVAVPTVSAPAVNVVNGKRGAPVAAIAR